MKLICLQNFCWLLEKNLRTIMMRQTNEREKRYNLDLLRENVVFFWVFVLVVVCVYYGGGGGCTKWRSRGVGGGGGRNAFTTWAHSESCCTKLHVKDLKFLKLLILVILYEIFCVLLVMFHNISLYTHNQPLFGFLFSRERERKMEQWKWEKEMLSEGKEVGEERDKG